VVTRILPPKLRAKASSEGPRGKRALPEIPIPVVSSACVADPARIGKPERLRFAFPTLSHTGAGVFGKDEDGSTRPWPGLPVSGLWPPE